MYTTGILFVVISTVQSEHLKLDLNNYFESGDLNSFKNTWMNYRPAIENAVAAALQDATGKKGLNILVMKASGLDLVTGYLHDHGPVKIILNDLHLAIFPHSWLPEVSIPLESNVVKIETKLSNMLVYGGYSIIRNHSDIITDIKKQNVYMNSPFLLQTVQPEGKIALTLEGCMLSGYVVARLSITSVNLGHHKFTLTNCDYIIEIYQHGDRFPPIISRFSAMKNNHGLEIKHLLLKPISEEITQKLQGIMFNFINTTAIFGRNLPTLIDKQSRVFQSTLNNFAEIIRDLNMKIVNNSAASILEDFHISWNDGIIIDDIRNLKAKSDGLSEIVLSDMILTGLDTAYFSNTGGPYKLNSIMIGEQIRFNTLQIRGYVHHIPSNKHGFKFAAEISDFAVNIDLDVETIKLHTEMAGFRKIEFSEPGMILGLDKDIIIGHLLNVVPKIVHNILISNLPIDLSETRISKSAPEENDVSWSDEGIEAAEELRRSNKANVAFAQQIEPRKDLKKDFFALHRRRRSKLRKLKRQVTLQQAEV